ncbi:hypothetical protein ACLMJK_008793 [Lecanora helva]
MPTLDGAEKRASWTLVSRNAHEVIRKNVTSLQRQQSLQTKSFGLHKSKPSTSQDQLKLLHHEFNQLKKNGKSTIANPLLIHSPILTLATLQQPPTATLLATLTTITLTLASPSSPTLQKRTDPSVQIFGAGDCSDNSVYHGTYSPGPCHNFPDGGGNYGAIFTDDQGCQYTVFEGEDCSGDSTTHGQNGPSCVPIANNAQTNVFTLTGGGASIRIAC